jgi:hypothetical protein
MIVGDFNVKGVAILPAETDSILIVNSDAILPGSVSLQSLQPVCRRRCQIPKLFRAIDLDQPAESDAGDLLERFDAPLMKDRLGIFVPKRADQTNIILRLV